MPKEPISREEIELRFLEQEHRTLKVWYNVYAFVLSGKGSSEEKTAATTAAISWFLSPAGVISVTLPIGAFLGAWFAWSANNLLDAQNNLLRSQNDLIVKQNIEMRASRETQVFVSQLTPLIDLITDPETQLTDEGNLVDMQIAGRISTFAQALGPYVELDVDGVSHQFSPERGRLMTALYSVGFPLSQMPEALNFGFPQATFENVDFGNAAFERVKLPASDLRTVSFVLANMRSCDLSNALLPEPSAFSGAILTGCDIEGAFVSSENWLNELAVQRQEINRQNRPCPDKVIKTEFEVWRWRVITLSTPDGNNYYRTRSDRAADELFAIKAELDLLMQGGVFDEPFDAEKFAEDFGELIVRSVEALNAQSLHSDGSVPHSIASKSRGDFANFVEGLGIPLEIFIRQGASFEGADLRNLSFVGSDLKNSNLRHTQLPRSEEFAGADVTGAEFEGADVSERSWIEELSELQPSVKGFEFENYEIPVTAIEIQDCDDPSKIYIAEAVGKLQKTTD